LVALLFLDCPTSSRLAVTPPTWISTLSLHDALPIWVERAGVRADRRDDRGPGPDRRPVRARRGADGRADGGGAAGPARAVPGRPVHAVRADPGHRGVHRRDRRGDRAAAGALGAGRGG